MHINREETVSIDFRLKMLVLDSSLATLLDEQYKMESLWMAYTEQHSISQIESQNTRWFAKAAVK